MQRQLISLMMEIYKRLPDHRLILAVFIIITTSFLVNPTSAQFKTPRAARFNSNAIWKGTPEVRFNNNNNNWFVICADSRWNREVATAVCYHRGFLGVMVMNTTSLNNPVRHASCIPDYSLSPPLYCEEVTDSSCSQVPRISCLLPGYQGCYRSTNSNPYFSEIPPQQFEQTLEDCARDCYSLNNFYFGVGNSQKCYCGDQNTPAPGEELEDFSCQTPCQGDRDQTCGGNNAVSVYEATLGQCGLQREISDGDLIYFTSRRFPNSYLSDSLCEDTLVISLESTGLEIGINYRLDNNDVLEVFTDSDSVNKTIRGGNGLDATYISNPEFGDVLHVRFQSRTSSSGGTFLLYFYAELNETDYNSFSSDSPTPNQTPTPDQPAETTLIPPPAANNLALYIGVGVAAAVVAILFIALLSVCITARRNRSKAAAGGHVDVNSATNVAYNIDNERVNTTTGNTPTAHSTEDTHRYATIDGGYYYAPTNGPQPPLPKPRDNAAAANQDAQYEELPGESAGTPYQSLTKTDRQAYQELTKNEVPSYTTLEPSTNEYLEPM